MGFVGVRRGNWRFRGVGYGGGSAARKGSATGPDGGWRLRGDQVKCPGADVFEGGAVLLVQAQAQSFFAVGIEGNQVVIVIGATVHDAAAVIDGGVDESGGDAAILRLHVKGGVADFDIGVVAEQHNLCFRRTRRVRKLKNIYFPEAFDRMHSNGYYNPSP